MSNWIKCDERMPEAEEMVLCYVNDGEWINTVGYYVPCFNTWLVYYLGLVDVFKVSHWMPLPEPPIDCEM